MLKKIGKAIGIIIVVLVLISVSLYLVYNEPLPEGERSPQADSLAESMLEAINHEAYQNTRFLEWDFAGHNYKWDKQRNMVEIFWDDREVTLYTKAPDSSVVKVNNEFIQDPNRTEIVKGATARFNNDSFWLVAPHKAFDPGTERRIITLENGEKALLVTYTSGGTTPGDSYLWLMDASGRPMAWKMWVSVLPIGGLKSTWESWEKTESGTLISTRKKFLFIDLVFNNVKGWN